jgi:hypothetical protein
MTRKRIKGIAISYFGKAQKKHFWVARGKKGETSMELLDTPEAIFGAGIELGRQRDTTSATEVLRGNTERCRLEAWRMFEAMGSVRTMEVYAKIGRDLATWLRAENGRCSQDAMTLSVSTVRRYLRGKKPS